LIGRTLRDHYFVARALAEDLDYDPALHHELALWTDKWICRTRLEGLAECRESPEDAVARFRQRYGVVINHAVLDTLDLSPSHHAVLTVLKVHTLRHPFSVADPI
jgi:hypothetical protein